MSRYMMQVGTRSCCGKHRWPLLDIVETLATSGFEHIILEEVAFAGERVGLTLPLETGLSGDRAQALVDVILHRLSQSLGSNALCFTGNLTVTASVEADVTRAQEGLTLIKGKGLSSHKDAPLALRLPSNMRSVEAESIGHELIRSLGEALGWDPRHFSGTLVLWGQGRANEEDAQRAKQVLTGQGFTVFLEPLSAS